MVENLIKKLFGLYFSSSGDIFPGAKFNQTVRLLEGYRPSNSFVRATDKNKNIDTNNEARS